MFSRPRSLAAPLSRTFLSSSKVASRPLSTSSARRGEIPFQSALQPAANASPFASSNVSVGQLTPIGIELDSADGAVVPGACVFLGGKTLLWDVKAPAPMDVMTWKGWGKEMFGVFEVVGPRPEILLLGTGATVLPPPPFLRSYMASLGIQVDVMNTRDACSTYNMLAEEGRLVAAALLPVREVDPRTGVYV